MDSLVASQVSTSCTKKCTEEKCALTAYWRNPCLPPKNGGVWGLEMRPFLSSAFGGAQCKELRARIQQSSWLVVYTSVEASVSAGSEDALNSWRSPLGRPTLETDCSSSRSRCCDNWPFCRLSRWPRFSLPVAGRPRSYSRVPSSLVLEETSRLRSPRSFWPVRLLEHDEQRRLTSSCSRSSMARFSRMLSFLSSHSLSSSCWAIDDRVEFEERRDWLDRFDECDSDFSSRWRRYSQTSTPTASNSSLGSSIYDEWKICFVHVIPMLLSKTRMKARQFVVKLFDFARATSPCHQTVETIIFYSKRPLGVRSKLF